MGVLISGSPVYNPYEGDGKTVAMNANFTLTINSPTPEFPAGIHHYILLDVPTVQSTIRCLHGKLTFPPPRIF